MKLSLVLSGAILLIYPLGQSFLIIALLTFLWAITAEAFRPASYAILTSVVMAGDEKRIQATGCQDGKEQRIPESKERKALGTGSMGFGFGHEKSLLSNQDT